MPDPSSKSPTFEAASKHLERLNLLFAPFRAKALNPEHYDEKLKFWVQVIHDYLVSERRISFSIHDVQLAFRTKDGRRPACLADVVNHLLREDLVRPLDQWITNIEAQSTWCSWSIATAKWAVTTILRYSPLPVAVSYAKQEINPQAQFVHLLLFQEQEEKILTDESLTNTVMQVENWKKAASSRIAYPDDLDIMMRYLKSNRKLICDKVGDEQILKVTTPSLPQTSAITQSEKSQYDISRKIAILQMHMDALTDKQNYAQDLARVALKDGKREAAKQHLRTKKVAEERVKKLDVVLTNLTALNDQLESSTSDSLIIDAYEQGKKALTQQLKDSNLNVDRVTEAVLELQDALEQHDEVTSSLSQHLVPDDTADYDKELALLLDEDEPKTLESEQGASDDVLRQLDDINMEDLSPLITKISGRPSKLREEI